MTERIPRRFNRPSGAVLSRCRRYRYALWRTWAPAQPKILFVGLNPSRADECADDPTIRRCIGFARAWGFGGLLVGNLFAWRTANPGDLRRTEQPIGPGNCHWLTTMSRTAERILVCWGRHGRYLERDRAFAGPRDGLWCLGTNRDGSPTHPLYLPADRRPRRWPQAAPTPDCRPSRMTRASSRPSSAG